MIALIEHARSIDKPVHVVSADPDWSRVCAKNTSLVHITRLSELLDRAVRAEWLSDDLWSEDELLNFLRAKSEKFTPLLESRLASSTSVNLGDGSLDSLAVEDLQLEGISITDIRPKNETITFGAELFHSVRYTAQVSIDDEEWQNVIEDELSGNADLVASIEIDLPLNHPSDVEVVSIDYFEGLQLTVPLDFDVVR